MDADAKESIHRSHGHQGSGESCPFSMAPMISFDLLLVTKVFQRALAERDIGEISVWWPEPCGQLCGRRKGCGLVGGLLNVVAV
jgi:hypothetical protein